MPARRSRTATIRVLIVLSLAAAILGAPSATGLAPDAHGWWWKGQPDALPVKVPAPLVPVGGLLVASDVTGPSAVGALRFTIPSGGEADKIVLSIANIQGTAAIRLCPAVPGWKAADGGPFGAAPGYDCAKSTIGTLSASNDAFSFFADDAEAGGVIDVVLVAVPDGALYPTFTVSFFPPDANTLTLAGSGQVPPPPPPNPAPFIPPPTTAPFAPPVTIVSPPAPVPAQPTVAVVPQAARPLRGAEGLDDGARIALLLLMTMGAAYFFGNQGRQRTPRLLGAFAGGKLRSSSRPSEATQVIAPTRGIGRFARPREGSAPRL